MLNNTFLKIFNQKSEVYSFNNKLIEIAKLSWDESAFEASLVFSKASYLTANGKSVQDILDSKRKRNRRGKINSQPPWQDTKIYSDETYVKSWYSVLSKSNEMSNFSIRIKHYYPQYSIIQKNNHIFSSPPRGVIT